MAEPNVNITTPSTVVVITGAGGMGLAIAQRLGSGHHVVLADYSPETLQAAATHLRTNGFTTTAHNVDISDAASTAALAAAAAALGSITTVVHTAGLSPVMSSAARIYAVDLVGTVNVIEAFAPVMAPQGAMVCMASVASHTARLSPEAETHLATAPVATLLEACPGIDVAKDDPATAYGISKRANVLRVQAAAHVYGQRGARINAVSPGIVATPMGMKELQGSYGEHITAMLSASPVKRIGTPSDVTDAVAFLSSSQASYITGANLPVDGGSSLWIQAAMKAAS